MTSSDARPRPVEVVRSLLVAASLPLCFVWSLLVGAWHRSTRAAANAGMASFGRVGWWLSGLELEVRGAEHIDAERPAVFVINHASALDFLVAVKLLRRDVTGVAKRELARHPIVGPIFRVGGVVFIDRSDRDQAVAELDRAREAIARGISIVVAPEGTRRVDGTVGRFRKGAFRVAMAAGCPVVPIVIDGARRCLPPGAWVLRSGRIRVMVLAPIPTKDWTLETLDRQIASLEARYRAEIERGDDAAARRA